MRLLLGFFILCVAGCNTPGAEFRGIDPVRISIGQSVFDIRVEGLRAQAIRVNAEIAPRLASVAPRGVLAIERVSGCRVRRLTGDQAVMLARLDCGGSLPPLPGPKGYDCVIEGEYKGYADLICEPFL